ncbi:hypothetical protein OROGR_025790 [Orobanche gracilis]
MSIPTLSHLFVVSVVLLALVPKSGCRQISTPAIEESHNEQRLKAKFSFFYLKHFKTIFPYEDSGKNKRKEMHVVVRRLVPAGPNRLHH